MDINQQEGIRNPDGEQPVPDHCWPDDRHWLHNTAHIRLWLLWGNTGAQILPNDCKYIF